jgi:acyl-CoA thioester hydrolase
MSTLIEVGRNSVQSWECDTMGHMNVQFYVARASEGLAALAAELGLGPNYTRVHDTAFYPIDQHLRFLRELRPGTPFTMHAGVLEAEGHSLRAYLEMRHALTEAPAATFIMDCIFAERSGLRPKSMPSGAFERVDILKTVLPAHGTPRGVSLGEPGDAPTLEYANSLNLFHTYQGVVMPQDCDTFGYMMTRAYMGRVSDAIPNLLAQLIGRDRGQSDVGGAALEYRFVFRKAAQVGDVLGLRSGLKSVGGKTYTFVHWLFDLDTGDIVATAEAIAVSLDLTARKAIEIPPEMRAQLEKHLVAGLSV